MAIRERDLPTIIIERIAHSHPAPALFAIDETDEWPENALTSLLKSGLLRRMGRAETVVCPGCEWQCHKAVVVRTSVHKGTAHAFIPCDEDPGHGRVPISLDRLEQYASGLFELSRFIAGSLRLKEPRISASGAFYDLGQVKGRLGYRSVTVGQEAGYITFAVGSQRDSMDRLLRWKAEGLVVDTEHIIRLANRKEARQPSHQLYQPDRSRQQTRSKATRKRDKAILEEAKRLRKAHGSTWSDIARTIAETDVGDCLSPGRVLRIVTAERKRERENSRSKRR